MADTYSGEIYCVKCKEKRKVSDAQVSLNDKGTRVAKGKCPTCGTNLTRFLKKTD